MTAPRLLEGLPGIDWGSPDTYETADEDPEVTRHLNEIGVAERSEESVISKIDTSVANIQTSLKDRYLEANRVDFSDAPVKAGNFGYTTGLSLVSGEETTSQKLHRIVCELEEISGELNAREGSADGKSDVSVREILQEIEAIRRRVGTLISSQVSAQMSVVPDSKAVADLQRMIVSSSDNKDSSSSPLYRLYHRPDVDQKYNLTKTVELEARLSNIESFVGCSGNTGAVSHIAGVKHEGVFEQLSSLESKIAVLDPAKLDLIDARLVSILSKLQSASTASTESLQMEPAKLQKLLHLHELLSSSSEQLHLLPKVIDRLTALSELHSQAVQVIDAVSFVEKNQAQLDSQLNTCQQLLDGVAHSLEKSSADIAAFCRQIEEKSAINSKPK